MRLTENEKKIIQALLESKKEMPTDEIAKKVGIEESKVISIVNVLAQKGLLNINTLVDNILTLTIEGEDYAENGLPEIRLIKALRKKASGIAMHRIEKAAGIGGPTKGIALSWSKKKNWVEIKKSGSESTIALTFEGKRALSEKPIEQELLELIKAGKVKTLSDAKKLFADAEKAVNILIQRKLIIPKQKKTFFVSITNEERAKRLMKVRTDGILDLTSDMLISGSWKGKPFVEYDVEAPTPKVYFGKKHPYGEFIKWLKEILVGMGFEESKGPFVETEFWNYDVLFVPQDHVAREMHDLFRIKTPAMPGQIPKELYYDVAQVHENGGKTGSIGWQHKFSEDVTRRLILRSHTTAVSVRFLWERKTGPLKMFSIDRNFRSEKLSAKHGQEFNQCEGIIMDKKLTLKHLMGYISEICKALGLKKLKWKPGQFPFTEPSIEGFVKHEKLGWIEVAPGGIFRPEVTHPLGIKDPVLAWGLGADRLFMAAADIADIRELFSRDLNWLRRVPLKF